MADPTTSITLTDLRREVSFLVGWDTTYGNLSAKQAQAVDDAIDSGYRTFLQCPNHHHRWTFLEPLADLTLVAPYTTGTVTIASGVVTGSGTVFPSWAAQGVVEISGSTYRVDTRDSDTQLTLEDTSLDADAGSTYSLTRVEYDLADNYGGMIDAPWTYEDDDDSFGVNSIRQVSESRIRYIAQRDIASGRPEAVAVYVKAVGDSTSDSERYVAQFQPPPDQQYTIQYRYRVSPNLLSVSNTKPAGGAEHAETIIAACLAAAEEKILDRPNGLHREKFYQINLPASVRFDQQMNRAHYLGLNTDNSDEHDRDYRNFRELRGRIRNSESYYPP